MHAQMSVCATQRPFYCRLPCRLHGNLHGHLVQLDRGCHLRRRHALVVQELQVAQLSEDGAAV